VPTAPPHTYHPAMASAAKLRDDGAGLVPAGRGGSLPLTGADEVEAETDIPEDFLVLSGEAILTTAGRMTR
jgi:hypothetical protein